MKLKKRFLHTYGIQNLENVNYKNLEKSLKSEIITSSKLCEKLEKEICKITNSKYSVVCNNGTSAIMMSLLSLSKKKLIVIIPNINFVAAINILCLLNAEIILCDVNKETGMVDEDSLSETIKECKKNGKKPNIFIPIHYAGDVLDIKSLSKVCKINEIRIIEDGCHSFGSRKLIDKEEIVVGQSKYSELTTFSFHPVKNITSVEGGAITTNNKKLYQKLILLRSHSLKKTFNADPYKMIYPTLNFRMGEINAAIGLDQIKELNKFKDKRNQLVKYYNQKLEIFNKNFKILNYYNPKIFWHIFVIKLKKNSFKTKIKLMNFLNKNYIASQIHYKPIYKHTAYKKKIILNKKINSDIFYKSQITLPLHTRMNKTDIDYIFKKLSLFFNGKN